MLRLPPSDLVLGNRDMAWHKHRFELRKVKFEHFVRTGEVCFPGLPLRSYSFGDPFRAPGDVDALFSSDPVSVNTNAFWEEVLENAACSLVEPPLARASFHNDRTDISCSSPSLSSVQDMKDWKDSLGLDGVVAPRYSHSNQYGRQSTSVSSTESVYSSYQENHRDRVSSQPNDMLGHDAQGRLHTNSRDTVSLLRKQSDGDLMDMQAHFKSILDLDGIRDDNHLRKASFSRHLPDTSATKHENQQIRTNLSAYEDPIRSDEIEQSSEFSDSGSSVVHHDVSNSGIASSVLPVLDRIRKGSGTLPRSPLHMSQAVPSSSPEKRSQVGVERTGNTYEGSEDLEAEEDGSFSDEADESFPSQDYLDGYDSESRANEVESGILRSQGGSTERQRLERFSPLSSYDPRASSPGAASEDASFMPDRSAICSTPPLHQRGRSPQTAREPTIYDSVALETSSPRLPSRRRVAARNCSVSFSFPLSPSIPTYENAMPPQSARRLGATARDSLSLLPPRTNDHGGPLISDDIALSPPSSPPLLSGRQRASVRPIRVYDDAALASNQPQTPIGLPRYGLPPMSMDGTFAAPPAPYYPGRGQTENTAAGAATAAAAAAGRMSQATAAGPSVDSTYEQENVRGESRREQQARMVGGMARVLQRAVGMLDRTPPRGDETTRRATRNRR